MTFEEDIEYFEANKEEFMNKYQNMFILIKDKAVHGIFSNFQDAHKKALELFGIEDVLIVQMTDQKTLNYQSTVS
jgi:purine-nucleoside phosphorylase